MRKKIMRFFTVFTLLFIVGSIIFAKPCEAASAEVTLSADSTDITVGDKIFVYINIDSSTEFGNFEANVTYNDDILEYDGGASVITGGSGFLKVSDMNVLNGDTSRKYTLEFTGLQVGLCKIDFSGRAMVYDIENGNEMSVSSNVLTINVKAPATASTNANLKLIKISPSQLTPAFDPGVHDYQASVSYDTEQMVITALPEDSKAIVSISGNDFLKEGENKIVVRVLAESGDIIEYNINVFRESEPAQTTDEAAVTPVALGDSFELKVIGNTTYTIFNGKYTIIERDDSVAIPEGYKEGSVTISGITMKAYLPENNEESEFFLIYAKNEHGDAGYYQYDRIEKTLQRFLPENQLINGGSGSGNTASDKQTQRYKDNMTKAVFVIALLSALCTIMIFVTIRISFKLKGFHEDDLDL